MQHPAHEYLTEARAAVCLAATPDEVEAALYALAEAQALMALPADI